MVQSVLSQYDDESLEVHVVWIAAIRTDHYEASLESRNLITDERVKHYWDGDQLLGGALAQVLNTRMDLAWDVYVAYDGEASWDGSPPEPSAWLHQKGSEDPRLRMNPSSLEAMLKSVSK